MEYVTSFNYERESYLQEVSKQAFIIGYCTDCEIEQTGIENYEITFNQDLYEKNKFYRITADYISQINNQDIISEEMLLKIQEIYEKNKERYESIALQSEYFPPEFIAAIHYRESAKDYLAESFGVYLHNGDLLGKESKRFLNRIFLDGSI